MSFDKNYPNRKDQRKPYHKLAQRCDRSCRPNGGCPWCEGNRLNKKRNIKKIAQEEIDENSNRLCDQ